MLADPACLGNLLDTAGEALFEPQFWAARGELVPVNTGRGAAWFLESGPHRWVLRHYRRGGYMARFVQDRYLWAGEARVRAFAEYRLLAGLVRRGLPVPKPIAARYRRAGLIYRCDLIMQRIADAKPLSSLLAVAALSDASWRAIGATIARLHQGRVDHADLNAHNILLDGQGVDQRDRLRSRPCARPRPRARARTWTLRNLSRLRRSLAKVSRHLPPDRFSPEAWEVLAGRLRIFRQFLRQLNLAPPVQRIDGPSGAGGIRAGAVARLARSQLLAESERALRMGAGCGRFPEYLAACGVARRGHRRCGAGSRAARSLSTEPVRVEHRDADGARSRAGAVWGRHRRPLPALRYAGLGRAILDANTSAFGDHHGDRTVAQSALRMPAARRAGGARERAPDGEIRVAVSPSRHPVQRRRGDRHARRGADRGGCRALHRHRRGAGAHARHRQREIRPAARRLPRRTGAPVAPALRRRAARCGLRAVPMAEKRSSC